MRLVLAARRSELARIQAFQVGRALEQTNPQLTIEYSFHESLGDRNQNDPLWQMPEKGVFTQDLREGLLARRYDLAVHSWKDLAIEDDGRTEIAATLPRALPFARRPHAEARRFALALAHSGSGSCPARPRDRPGVAEQRLAEGFRL